MIKLKSGLYKANHFNYYWNGTCLQTIVSANSKHRGKILEVVPKKYYHEIMFMKHTVSNATVQITNWGTRCVATQKIKEDKILLMER